MNRSSLVPRWLYLAFACVMLALGIIGIVLPGLPTTPFILLAAQGAVRRGNKWLATITMLACAVILLLTAPRLWMAATGISVMLLTGIWLWLRPEPCANSSKGEQAGQGH